PDFNPIEQLFAKLKALLRRAAERSVAGLWNRIARLLDQFPPNECANYFRNAGYASCYVETALSGHSYADALKASQTMPFLHRRSLRPDWDKNNARDRSCLAQYRNDGFAAHRR